MGRMKDSLKWTVVITAIVLLTGAGSTPRAQFVYSGFYSPNVYPQPPPTEIYPTPPPNLFATATPGYDTANRYVSSFYGPNPTNQPIRGASPYNRSPVFEYGADYFNKLANFESFAGGAQQQCNVVNGPCNSGRFRTIDGTCNNLQNPSWGAANTNYGRLLPAKYSDRSHSPPESVAGTPLPGSRLLSIIFFPDDNVPDPIWTLAAMQWGQIMTHDMSMAAGTTQAQAHATNCCSQDGSRDLPVHSRDATCFPIAIPDDDPVYAKFGQRCMNFVRSTTDQDNGCVSKSQAAEQVVSVTHWMDASHVYGSSQQLADSLRERRGGRMIVELRGGKQWPPSVLNRTAVCDAQSGNEPCYMTGDVRSNQNPQLTVIQVMLVREHNRLADELSKINPGWNDERIYQEARRILIAEFQHISYYEWLPIFLGLDNLLQHGVLYNAKNAYVNDYNSNISPNVLNAHATSAFRYFHSNIQGILKLVSAERFHNGALRLSDYFNRPAVIEERNNFDDLTRGMATQPQQTADKFFTSEITDLLFKRFEKFGSDLRAFDIQRGRDHGLASYNDYRSFCGLPKAHRFADFLDVLSSENIQKLEALYRFPDDVDLVVAGSLERHVPGTLAGPTFLCIMTEQFYRTRVSDRFFYENGRTTSSFTPDQLNEIRKASISRFFCDNGDNINSMQPRGFLKLSNSNQLTSCRDTNSIPRMNLDFWRDTTPQQKHIFKYYGEKK